MAFYERETPESFPPRPLSPFRSSTSSASTNYEDVVSFSESYIHRRQERKWREGCSPWSRDGAQLCWGSYPFILLLAAVVFFITLLSCSITAFSIGMQSYPLLDCVVEEMECRGSKVKSVFGRQEQCCKILLSLRTREGHIFELIDECFPKKSTRGTLIDFFGHHSQRVESLEERDVVRGGQFKCVMFDDIFLAHRPMLMSEAAAKERQTALAFLGADGIIFSIICVGVYIFLNFRSRGDDDDDEALE